MRIGVISDSHDNIPHIKKAVDIFNSNDVSFILHAGDYVAPFSLKALLMAKAQLIGIFGNNDGEKKGLKNLCDNIFEDPYRFTLQGQKITIIHDIADLDVGLKEESDIIIYGHSHKATIKKGKQLLLNPGECGGWLNGVSSVALLDIDEMDAEIINI